MIACCRCKACPSSSLSSSLFKQPSAQADRCTGKTGAQADSKKKIIVSQMEDSKQAAAKAEVEQYA